MVISTPTKSGQPINKLVTIAGGIMIQVAGTRYNTTAEVLEIDEANQRVRAKGVGFECWVEKAQIKDAISPGDFAVQTAINGDDD